MQRSATKQVSPCVRNTEVSDVLGHLEFCPGQHYSVYSVTIDQLPQSGDIGHPGLADDERVRIPKRRLRPKARAKHATELLLPPAAMCRSVRRPAAFL
jgi:hypothetical protein